MGVLDWSKDLDGLLGEKPFEIETSEIQKLWLQSNWIVNEDDFFLCDPKVSTRVLTEQLKQTVVSMRGYVWEQKQDPIVVEWPKGWTDALRLKVANWLIDKISDLAMRFETKRFPPAPKWLLRMRNVKLERKVIDLAVVYPALRIGCSEEKYRVVRARVGGEERFWREPRTYSEKEMLELTHDAYRVGFENGQDAEKPREGALQAIEAIADMISRDPKKEAE